MFAKQNKFMSFIFNNIHQNQAKNHQNQANFLFSIQSKKNAIRICIHIAFSIV